MTDDTLKTVVVPTEQNIGFRRNFLALIVYLRGTLCLRSLIHFIFYALILLQTQLTHRPYMAN